MKKLLIILSAILLLSFDKGESPVIFMIGDSTMANKNIENSRQERGWGQMLPGFLDANIKVDNRAMNGRSSKSFRDEGRWDYVMERIKPGDYVFIQFGHNDQKTQEKLYAAHDGAYRDNMKRYIKESRDKGATPVLFTSIARRHFDSIGNLKETLDGYIDAVREVGKETGVTVIDMNRSTTDLIKSMPQEESKKIFMWIPKNTLAVTPNGIQDNTHLNIYGGRVVAGLAVKEMAGEIPALAPFFRNYDIVVAKDGSGDYMTIQQAIDAVTDIRNTRTTIYVRNGTYKEKVVIPQSKQNLTLIGEDVMKTIITYDDFASKKNKYSENIGTSGSSSIYIYPPDFVAENITFENSAGNVGQAVAVYTEGDRMTFRNCRLIGNQDTLYTHAKKSRQYYTKCYIEGTVDFIFGSSTAVFEDCEMHTKRSGSYITAASTQEDTPHGYLFLNCRLTADQGIEKVYLGRPWRPYAKTVFINCEMGAHINSLGWHNWSKPENEKTAFYAEFGNKGKGADLSKRVEWMHKLSAREAAKHTPEAMFEDWNYKTK